MNKALDFIEIQRQALDAKSQKALAFVIVNQTLKLIPYKQAIFWTGDTSPKVEAVSGNATIDEKAPYGMWFKNIVRKHSGSSEDTVTLSAKDVLADNDEKWCAGHIAIVSLHNGQGDKIGGLWIERDTAFKDSETALLSELKPAWETQLALLRLENKKHLFSGWQGLRRRQKYFWIAVLLLMFMPVQVKITAPAEIVAQEKMVATAPYEGIVRKVLVKPGEQVEQEQVLAVMESEKLAAEARATEQALETARSSLSRIKREALSAPEKKADINVLENEIKAKEIEYEYAQSKLERSEIKSPRSGVAIFSDANQFEGKPVVTGDTIMEIAAPGDIELLVRVPVDALAPFDENASIDVYLNVAPLKKIKAEITTVGYQASPDPDGLLTYKLRAKLDSTPQDIRIGWKGTAKIHGEWTILAYSILRRPLIALRRLGGG